jgi:GNAT superfamily N-acetyltransferase
MKRTRHKSGLQQRFLVRKATSRDLELLVRHRRGMWIDLGIREKAVLDEADRAYWKWAKSALRNRSLVGWVAETRDGLEVGSGCIWLRAAQPRPNLKKHVQPYLLSMYTEPRFRRKGVASLIVREAIKWCKKNGHSRLALHASRQGRGLYTKFGFSRTWEMRLNLR